VPVPVPRYSIAGCITVGMRRFFMESADSKLTRRRRYLPPAARERRKSMLKLRRLGPVMPAVAISAVLTVTGAGIAAANTAGPAQHVAAHSATAKKLPCLTLWAVVNKFGVLQRAGCPGTSSAFVGDGYQVLFYRNVRHCAYVASAGNAGSRDVPIPAVVSTVGRAGRVKGVFVGVVDLSGNRIQRGFHLIVECKQPA
jgi:hypothetical protein